MNKENNPGNTRSKASSAVNIKKNMKSPATFNHKLKLKPSKAPVGLEAFYDQ